MVGGGRITMATVSGLFDLLFHFLSTPHFNISNNFSIVMIVVTVVSIVYWCEMKATTKQRYEINNIKKILTNPCFYLSMLLEPVSFMSSDNTFF